MRKFSIKWLIAPAVMMLLMFMVSAASAKKPTTMKDNVTKSLTALNLLRCVDFLEEHEEYVIVRPRVREDGTVDNCLMEYILQSRAEGKKEWTHDNIVLSTFWGHGRHSYRQRGEDSIQVTCSYKGDSTVPYRIKLDVDKHPPSGGQWVKSGKHILDIVGEVFGKKKDQESISAGLDRRYATAKK
jgi:hypothetical protein